MNTERKPGYYRVKLKGESEYDIMWYDDLAMEWLAVGTTKEYDDSKFTEIIETPISPEPPETMTREELIEKAKEYHKTWIILKRKQLGDKAFVFVTSHEGLFSFIADFTMSLLTQNQKQ